MRLGAGESLHDILSSSKQVAEGVTTAGQPRPPSHLVLLLQLTQALPQLGAGAVVDASFASHLLLLL